MKTTKRSKAREAILITLGLLMIFSAASLFIYNTWDDNRASQAGFEASQVIASAIGNAQADASAQPVIPGLTPGLVADQLAADAENQTEHSVTVNNVDYIGMISIPSLGLSNLPVTDEWNYPNLKTALCRYVGTIADNNIVIAAHNYAKFFGNINKLMAGDAVVFTDAAGVDHHYAVALVETLQPTDIDKMTDSGYALTLFTCTYGGKSRVTVRCVAADQDTQGQVSAVS